jgi:L-threonylcarbamoyladenylate synthase
MVEGNSAAHRDTAAAVGAAAAILAEGGLVAFPTETVYGLGARADDDAAVAAIFAAKGRPVGHPLIVHVAGPAQAAAFAATMPPVARRLVTAFWPGPLTIIVPRAAAMANAAAGGHASVGLRCPAHPVAQALLAAALQRGVPGIAAPSANRFGRISPTTAQHVRDEFGLTVHVVDGGPCDLGIESAIVDCSGDHPVLLRPGALTRSQIETAAGEPLQCPAGLSTPAPGTLAAHYAPNARLCLMPTEELQAALTARQDAAGRVAVYSRLAQVREFAWPDVWRVMPDNAAAAAHELFATLRELDRTDIDQIWVEQPPDAPEWDGVRDRLERAAAAH